jgi:hypothetical protein
MAERPDLQVSGKALMSNVMQPATVLVPAPRRFSLGLPAGSVRAILALAVLGLLWVVALAHPQGKTVSESDKHLPTILIALQILMVLVLVHFFTAHGHTIGRHISGVAPLGLPSGVIRLVLAAGYIGLSVFLLYNQADFDLPDKNAMWSLLIELVVVLVSYFAGMLISRCVRLAWGDPPPAPYQDVEAWVAILALLGLGLVVLIHLINRNVAAENRISLDVAQAVLSGLIGLYFGARS